MKDIPRLLAPMVEYAVVMAKYGLEVMPVHNPIFTSTGVMCDCRDGYACKAIGKHPVGKSWQESATTDLAKIRRQWALYPRANAGIPTGLRFKRVVLDADGPEGVAELEELEAKVGRLPLTLTSETPSGGQHRFFAYDGAPIFNSAKVLAPHVDVRGEGGQVVGPPSLHWRGRRYRWLRSPLDIQPASLPRAWIETLLALAPDVRSPSRSRAQHRAPASFAIAATHGPRETRALLLAMLKHPLVAWMCDSPDDVPREVWRGVAVNFAAAVDEHAPEVELARQAFHTISEDYAGYSRRECDVVFLGAFASARTCGPMRFDTMIAAGAPPEVCAGGTTLIHASRRMIGR